MEKIVLSPAVVQASSGDMVADRRYAWALGALESQDARGAADLFAQTAELVPHWAPAWFGLGAAQQILGATQEAIMAFQKALALAPEDSMGAGLRLARLRNITPPHPPDAYVRELFDAYAARFETHLVAGLGYRGPELLRHAVESFCTAAARPFHFAGMIDLGCGTGLMGRLMADCCGTIVGVDLAPAMVEMTRRAGGYARVEAGELVAFLQDEPAGSADLVLAADVFIYVGALEDTMAAIARVLRPGGLCAATVQTVTGSEAIATGFQLGDDLRYAHSAAYLRDVAAGAGLLVAQMEPGILRRERGKDVPGLVPVLVRP